MEMKNIANNIANKTKDVFSKIKFNIDNIKETFSNADTAKRENYIIGGSGATLALVIVVSVALSAQSVEAPSDLAYEAVENSSITLTHEAALEVAGVEYVDGVRVAREVYAVIVDGEDVVYVISRRDAKEVLHGVVDRHRTRGSEILDRWFMEDVTIEKREFEWPAPVFSVYEAVTYILTGATAPRVHVVASGDNLWDIAAVNNISVYQLKEMNPDLNYNRLQIGAEVNLYDSQPFITIGMTEVVETQERIPYEIIFEDTDELYIGQTQVRVTGTPGSRGVRTQVTRENGGVVEETVVDEELIAEPVTQVVVRGTRPAPASEPVAPAPVSEPVAPVTPVAASAPVEYTPASEPAAASEPAPTSDPAARTVESITSNFVIPVTALEVSSHFGPRGGRHHNGVDLRRPHGDPVFAVYYGVVIQSNFSGSFGNVIIIDHGSGVHTLYSHNTTNLVSVGQTVTRGQQIATIGSTGNATGAHLHFEVRINGRVRNPMNFLR